MKTIRLLSLFFSFITFALSACQPTETLPTAAILPSQDVADASTSVSAEATATPLAARTLPATFTLTPTFTPTPTTTLTETASVTPSATITDTPTSTATLIPTMNPEERARTSLLLDLELRLTDLPPGGFVASPVPMTTLFPATTPQAGAPENGTPSVILINSGNVIIPTAASQGVLCAYFPPGGFATVFNTNPDLAVVLGCPVGAPPNTEAIQAAVQPYQFGIMIWLNGTIYVMRATDNTFLVYPDTFTAGVDPETTSETPPSGLIAPMRGFLKVWSGNPGAHDLGWALQAEVGAQAVVQRFERGLMIYVPGRQDILVLMNASGSITSGTWRSVIGQF